MWLPPRRACLTVVCLATICLQLRATDQRHLCVSRVSPLAHILAAARLRRSKIKELVDARSDVPWAKLIWQEVAVLEDSYALLRRTEQDGKVEADK